MLNSTRYIKQVLSLSLPMAGSRFLQMFSGFIGMMMVAHLGPDVIAASGLINATLSALLLIFMSIIFAMSFVVGETFGTTAYHRVGALVQQGVLLSVLLAIVMMITFLAVDPILRYFHQKLILVHYARLYFHALMWGAIPIMLQACLQQFCYGVLKQRMVIIINFITMLISIVTAYSFIFGHFGFPKMGIAGLAYSFDAQASIGFLITLGWIMLSKDFQKYHLFQRHSHQGLIYLRKLMRVGWPMSVQFGGELLAFFVITMMIGWLGTSALAATHVTQQWLLLVIVPIFAMSEAGGILVGHAVGAKQYDQLSLIGRANIGLAVIVVGIVDAAFLISPDFFSSFYITVRNPQNAAILHLIRVLFAIMTLTLLFNAARDVVSGLLRGLFDTQFPMRAGLFVMWCLVLPIGYAMAFWMHMGVVGFRIGGNIALLIGFALVYWRWKSRIRVITL